MHCNFNNWRIFCNTSLICSIFQPRENFNEWRLIYFISFLLLVGFFVLNMFVGVVVENFHRCRAEQEKEERARRAAKRAKKIEERRRSMKYSFFHLFSRILSSFQYYMWCDQIVIKCVKVKHQNLFTFILRFFIGFQI